VETREQPQKGKALKTHTTQELIWTTLEIYARVTMDTMAEAVCIPDGTLSKHLLWA
jgi:hypothetical protein